MKKVFKVLLYSWNYVKDSWEGKDGKLSYRRVSQYIFLVCMIKSGFWPPHNKWEFYVFMIFAALYLSVVLVLSTEQILNLIKFTLPIVFKTGAMPEELPPADTPPDATKVTD